jgi:ATP-dependent DNA helicase RecG
MAGVKKIETPLGNNEIIKLLCDMDESTRYEFKRVSNKMVHKALETVVAFANTEGGFLVLDMEDFKKTTSNLYFYYQGCMIIKI